MKDLDFDELDRAVASALNTSTPVEDPVSEPLSQPAPAMAKPADSPSVSDADSASSSISAHAVHSRLMPSAAPSARTTLARKPTEPTDVGTGELVAVSESAPSPQVETTSSLRRTIPHREGRFMDVMRSSSQIPRPPQQASAQEEAPVATKSSSDSELGADDTTNTPLEAAINELLASEGHVAPTVVDVPQPTRALAAMDVASKHEIAEAVVSDEESLASIAADLGKPAELTPEAVPSNSPFLADAKVEKRPLGAAGEPTAVVSAEPELAPEPTIAAPETENTPMPEELQSDLMAIESAAAPDVASEVTSDESVSADTAPQASVATGPTSIARQYKEQPRTASEDDESGAIFDPQTYQQPIEHPAKKSSGWGWVIGIIVIILLAVGAAVAAWFGGILPVQL